MSLKLDFIDMLPLDEIDNSCILITGGNGLLATSLIKNFIELAHIAKINLKIIASSRSQVDISKFMLRDGLVSIKTVSDNYKDLLSDEDIHYVIHTASPTASEYFVSHAIETIHSIVVKSYELLEMLKKQKSLKSVIYLSSMEVYGVVNSLNVKEDDFGLVNFTSPRSSYTESKRITELLFLSYYRELALPIKIVRPTLIIGPSQDEKIKKVHSQFAEAVLKGEDIILYTDGQSGRDFIDIQDACLSILAVAFLGKNGEIYNVSNPETFRTIEGLAKEFLKFNKKSSIKFLKQENSKYPPNTHCKLNIDKLISLYNFKFKSLDSIISDYISVKKNGM